MTRSARNSLFPHRRPVTAGSVAFNNRCIRFGADLETISIICATASDSFVEAFTSQTVLVLELADYL